MFVRTAVSRLGGLRTCSKLIRSPNTLASVSFNASHQSSGLLNVPASPLSTSFLLSSSSSSSAFGCSSTSFVSSSFWAPSRRLLSTAEAKEEDKQVGDSEAEVSRKKPETVEESLELFDSQAKMIRKILKENKRPIVPRPARILQMLYQWKNLNQARKREFYEVLALSQKEGVTYEGSAANAIINFFREHHPTSAVEILRRLTPKTINKKIRRELKAATHSGPLDDLTTQLEAEQEAEEGGAVAAAEVNADGQEPFFRPRRYYRFYAGPLAVSRLIKTLAQDQHQHMVQRAFEVLDNVYLKYYEFPLDARGFKTILPSFVLASFRLPHLHPKVLTIVNSLLTKIEAKEIEFEASSLPLKAITSFAICHRDADLLARLETVLLPLIPTEFTGYKAAVLLALNKADAAAALVKAEASSHILPEHTSSLSLIVSVADFLHPQHPDGALTDRLTTFNEATSLPPVSPRAFDVKTLNYTTFN